MISDNERTSRPERAERLCRPLVTSGNDDLVATTSRGRRPERERAARLGAPDVLSDLRRLGFDLDRPVCVTHLVGLASYRQATSAHSEAAKDGWQATTHVDSAGWVVRIVQQGMPTDELIDVGARYAKRIARRHGGRVRGLTVEDPAEDDSWTLLAERVVARVSAIRGPAQRPAEGAAGADKRLEARRAARGA